MITKLVLHIGIFQVRLLDRLILKIESWRPDRFTPEEKQKHEAEKAERDVAIHRMRQELKDLQ